MRETNAPPRRGAVVIDARFAVVKRRGGVVKAFGNLVLAIVCALALGLLAPPAWALIARLSLFP